jgi:hypothetical protein
MLRELSSNMYNIRTCSCPYRENSIINAGTLDHGIIYINKPGTDKTISVHTVPFYQYGLYVSPKLSIVMAKSCSRQRH